MYNAILWTRFPEFFQKGFLSLVFSRSDVVKSLSLRTLSLQMLGQI